jgi:hypothetical protein
VKWINYLGIVNHAQGFFEVRCLGHWFFTCLPSDLIATLACG